LDGLQLPGQAIFLVLNQTSNSKTNNISTGRKPGWLTLEPLNGNDPGKNQTIRTYWTKGDSSASPAAIGKAGNKKKNIIKMEAHVNSLV
jgi:hypothetical protein